MKKINFVAAVGLSFGSKKLYREVGKSWGGRIFGYLILLELFCWVFLAAEMHQSLNAWVDAKAPAVIDQIPTITIENGKVRTDVEEPYFIRNPWEPDARPMFIIDTTGTYTELGDHAEAGLLTKDRAYVRQSSSLNEVRMYDLSTVQNFTLNAEIARSWMDRVAGLVFWVMLPLCTIGAFLWRLLLGLWYGLLGLIINGFLAEKSDFGTIYRTALMAMTPAILLGLVKSLTDVHIPFFWFISFLVAMGFLIFGLRAQSTDKPEPGPEGGVIG